jgi:hypothetical protein
MFGWDSEATEHRSYFDLFHNSTRVRIRTFIPENWEFRTPDGIFLLRAVSLGLTFNQERDANLKMASTSRYGFMACLLIAVAACRKAWFSRRHLFPMLMRVG